MTCILCMDFATAMHVLLLKNTKCVFPIEGFRLEVYLREFTSLRDTGSLPSVSVQSEKEVVRTINTQENILQMVQRSPRLSTLRMASSSSTARSYFGAAEHIRNHPDIITSATQSLLMRAENCIAAGGGHFEQLL